MLNSVITIYEAAWIAVSKKDLRKKFELKTKFVSVVIAVLIALACLPVGECFAEGLVCPSCGGEMTATGTVYEASCEAAGGADYVCSSCGAVTFVADAAALGHAWSDWEVVSEATCETDGVQVSRCTRCGLENYNYTPATGHNFEYTGNFSYPTCVDPGYREILCSNCGQTLWQVGDAAYGHLWGDWQVSVAATCTEGGTNVRYCQRCGVGVTATTEALGHTWGEWEIKKAATITEEGIRVRTCESCGETEEETYQLDGTYIDGNQAFEIYVLEQLLSDEGYSVGEIDGTFDSDVESAVRAFEKAEGLEENGVATDEMIVSLVLRLFDREWDSIDRLLTEEYEAGMDGTAEWSAGLQTEDVNSGEPVVFKTWDSGMEASLVYGVGYESYKNGMHKKSIEISGISFSIAEYSAAFGFEGESRVAVYSEDEECKVFNSSHTCKCCGYSPSVSPVLSARLSGAGDFAVSKGARTHVAGGIVQETEDTGGDEDAAGDENDGEALAEESFDGITEDEELEMIEGLGYSLSANMVFWDEVDGAECYKASLYKVIGGEAVEIFSKKITGSNYMLSEDIKKDEAGVYSMMIAAVSGDRQISRRACINFVYADSADANEERIYKKAYLKNSFSQAEIPENITYYYVKEAVNVRSGPSKKSDRIGSLSAGTVVPTYGRKDGFYKIIFDGEEAWIIDDVCREAKAEEIEAASGLTGAGGVLYTTVSGDATGDTGNAGESEVKATAGSRFYVYFDAGEGYLDVAYMLTDTGGKLNTSSLPVPKRDGFVFAGWKDTTGQIAEIISAEGDRGLRNAEYTLTVDASFSAIWYEYEDTGEKGIYLSDDKGRLYNRANGAGIGTVYNGTVLTKVGEEDGFVHVVTLDGQDGWVRDWEFVTDYLVLGADVEGALVQSAENEAVGTEGGAENILGSEAEAGDKLAAEIIEIYFYSDADYSKDQIYLSFDSCVYATAHEDSRYYIYYGTNLAESACGDGFASGWIDDNLVVMK